MGKTGWIIFSAITVVILGGLIAWNYASNPPIDVSNIDASKVIAASDQNANIGDNAKGSKDGKIVFVEYGDFQCPGCAGAYSSLKSLLAEYNDSVTFVFRNMPITTIHPNARAAASAAQAAGLQGKFWEMHDLIYESQSAWSNADTTKRLEIFSEYAKQTGADVEKFKTDMEGSAVSQKLRFDLAVAKKQSVTSTPTFFVNGELVDDETANGIVQGDLTKIKEKFDKIIAEQK